MTLTTSARASGGAQDLGAGIRLVVHDVCRGMLRGAALRALLSGPRRWDARFPGTGIPAQEPGAAVRSSRLAGGQTIQAPTRDPDAAKSRTDKPLRPVS